MRSSPSFVTEVPLQVETWQAEKLQARLEVARQVYNACLGECLKRARRLRESRLYRAAKKTRERQARQDKFRAARQRVGFEEYALHAWAKQFTHSWIGEHLDSHVIQKLASRAFDGVDQYVYGQRGKPRFKSKNQLDSLSSLEGKSNATGIRWNSEKQQVTWFGLILPAIIDEKDPSSSMA